MKPLIFLDFDGLKFNTTPALVSYVNERWDINSIESDYINQNDTIENIINRYKKEIVTTYDEVYKDLGKNYNSSIQRQQNVQPIKDMCKNVTLLSKEFTLWIVTARQKEGANVIRYLVDKHIPGCISGIHCVWELMDNGIFKETSKRDFIESMPGIKVAFIDDSPKEIIKMQSLIPSYLFDPDKLHGNEKEIENRVYSWNEIGEKFL